MVSGMLVRWVRSVLRSRGFFAPAMPARDEGFIEQVRLRFDPVMPAGFVFKSASSGVSYGPVKLASARADRKGASWTRETTVLYEADPEDFFTRFPGLRDALSPADDLCLDLWVALDVDRGTVRADLEGRDVSTLAEEDAHATVATEDVVPSREAQLDAYVSALTKVLGPPEPDDTNL